MEITIASRRNSPANLEKRFAGATILDLTSRGPQPWVKFSPFYPHGAIPIPFSPGQFGASVEGIWQALKVFESADVDRSKLEITTMAGLKRTSRKLGKVLGHRAGLEGGHLLSYAEARRAIYLPSYLWVLENRLAELTAELKKLVVAGPLVLLDYELNTDVNNLSRPLSHAGLVKHYLENAWPA